jgi:altronate hydrolase
MTARGFVFMDTLGFDPVSATGQVSGGANFVRFTTGSVSVFGCKPSPSIKIGTNTPMYRRMEEGMDVKCGTIVDGEKTVQQAGRRMFDLILRVTSGERAKSEQYDFGSTEFAPLPLGVTV